ncbi:ATP-binding protein [Streptomyces sp. NPDC048442]|uniref:ATP-binding protein n=1 Tax=Streptomyces sp. NPDC048442 TaxID=3154823 RepID=UPI0034302579
MNETTQLTLVRQKFYRRERRSVPAARAFVRWALEDWRMGPLIEPVLLCVSELATNALRHGVPPGREFDVRVLAGGGLLRIEVHDSGGGRVEAARPDGELEYGRGLLLVGALADRWGVGDREIGKVVWCEFAWPGADQARGS